MSKEFLLKYGIRTVFIRGFSPDKSVLVIRMIDESIFEYEFAYNDSAKYLLDVHVKNIIRKSRKKKLQQLNEKS